MDALFTIGHSNHRLVAFIEMLKAKAIEVVVDIRSAPYSRYVPQYNKAEIAKSLEETELQYLYLGDGLGGKPRDPGIAALPVEEKYVRIAESAQFQQGLDRLEKGLAAGWRIALMCAEENPLKCHRHMLVARELELVRHVPVYHLRVDGTSLRALKKLVDSPEQMRLFNRVHRL